MSTTWIRRPRYTVFLQTHSSNTFISVRLSQSSNIHYLSNFCQSILKPEGPLSTLVVLNISLSSPNQLFTPTSFTCSFSHCIKSVFYKGDYRGVLDVFVRTISKTLSPKVLKRRLCLHVYAQKTLTQSEAVTYWAAVLTHSHDWKKTPKADSFPKKLGLVLTCCFGDARWQGHMW